MNATSPGFHITGTNSSDLQTSYLKDESTLKTLIRFCDILASCYGPNGSFKMLQNIKGGHLIITSSSERLFHNFPVKSPILRLIVSAIQGHLKIFSDNGLGLGLFSSMIISKSIESNLNPVLISEILDALVLPINNIFENPLNHFDVAIELKLADLKCIVLSVIQSKQFWISKKSDVEHISKLILESFIYSFPTTRSNGYSLEPYNFITREGYSLDYSHIVPGLLIATAQNNSPDLKKLNLNNYRIRTVLSNISFSGDSEEFIDINYECCMDSSANDVVLKEIRSLCDKFIADDVGLVLCQKVVHPEIKVYLRQSSVVVIDRLGKTTAAMVESLTGANPINNLHPESCDEFYGYVDDLKIKTVCDTHYYHLTSGNSKLFTFFLCSKTEEALSELKHVCEAAKFNLWRAITNFKGVPGAGCFEIFAASVLKNKTLYSDILDCNKLQLQSVVNIITSSLEKIGSLINLGRSQTDNTYHHLWNKDNLRCNCGRYQYFNDDELFDICDRLDFVESTTELNITEHDYEIIDVKASKVNAFLTALSTAAMVLRTGTYIHESF